MLREGSNLIFFPVVATTSGLWEDRALKFFKSILKKVSTRLGDNHSKFYARRFYQKLSQILHTSNATSILSRAVLCYSNTLHLF